jgi:hypothetical protein
MKHSNISICVLAALVAGMASTPAKADDGRDFPEGITVDEPGIDDVVMLPQWMTIDHGASSGSPGFNENDLNFGFEKRLTENFGATLGDGYSLLRLGHGNTAAGWQNVSLNAKYVFLEDDPHELVLSGGVTRVFGATGARAVGADATGSTAPTFYFGKGMGDASNHWLRPLAVTANVLETLPDQANRQNPFQTTVAGSLQYDLAYLQPEGNEDGRAHWPGRFTPIVEAVYTTATSPADGGSHFGTVSPGLVYKSGQIQVSALALVPLTRETGRAVGAILQLNLFFSGRMGDPVFQ